MPTHILGISAFYHDSAAALLRDGEIVAAAQEERFTRKKHDAGFPTHAIQHCLEAAGLSSVEEIDFVTFYDKPLLKFDRLLETYLAYAPSGIRSFLKAMPVWLKDKLHIPRILKKNLGGKPKKPWVFTEHHESHAASAFFPSPFEDAAIVTMDGVGEWATTSIAVGDGNDLRMLREIHFPHSLGLLYTAFTYYCGFRVNSGEYKLMGLAPYGQPHYKDKILEHLIDLKEDGSYKLDLRYFDYPAGLRMTSRRFHDLFGQPPRTAETELTQFHMDVAASIQAVTEEAMLRLTHYAKKVSGKDNLCLAGGVALNCVGNGRILREGPFDKVWIQPAAGDAGGALGSAQFVWYQLLQNERQVNPLDSQSGSLLGPAFPEDEIEAMLDREKIVFEHYDHDFEMANRVAELLEDQNVVGWFQGRMEFGPRALGARSILGDARSPKMQSVMNLKIKFRESFRPFAPIVLEEDASEYFGIDKRHNSPYMLVVAPLHENKRKEVDATKTGLEQLHQIRSIVPAITHVDFSARLQTVDEHRNRKLAALMRAFKERTGSPVLINTSFNIRGEPIVCTPEDALRCFWGTEMDVLVLENYVICRDAQTNVPKVDRSQYLKSFALD
ncbi:MAG: carbamoyltransferase [Planctomycetota bacterium]|jgi:carbamoyltransferase|nr:carbamoyltransferase [Planctomycetota bacterium]